MTVRARLETQMTSLAACVNGSITLPGNEPSRFPVRDQWWKFRYPDDDWINIRYCHGSLNCVTMTSELPDGTRVSIGAHESLVVERIIQNSTKNRVQFLLEVFFEDNTVLRHSFEVNFTVVCKYYQNKSYQPVKDCSYYCYCAYVLRISRYSGFLSVVLSNTKIFLRGLKLCRESRTQQVLLVSKKKIEDNHAFF